MRTAQDHLGSCGDMKVPRLWQFPGLFPWIQEIGAEANFCQDWVLLATFNPRNSLEERLPARCGWGGAGKCWGGAGSQGWRRMREQGMPHLHMVHHHLIGQMAAVLGFVHFLVEEGLGAERGRKSSGKLVVKS